MLEAGEIADRRIQPDVEVLSRRIRYGDAEVGRIARDVPVAECLVLLAVEPLLRPVSDLALRAAGGRGAVAARQLGGNENVPGYSCRIVKKAFRGLRAGHGTKGPGGDRNC